MEKSNEDYICDISCPVSESVDKTISVIEHEAGEVTRYIHVCRETNKIVNTNTKHHQKPCANNH